MRERDTSAQRPSAIRSVAEFRLRGSDFTDRRLVVAIGLSVLALAGVATSRGEAAPVPSQTPAWSHVVIVDESHAAGPVLQAAFHRVAATGIGGNATAQILKRLGEYIDSEVAQRGKAGLSIGLIVDAAAASKAAKWPPEDTARLVIALHRKFDQAQPQEWPRLQRVVERVRQGSPPDEILGTGDVLKETAPPR